MDLYCAPMEGVTGYLFRNAHHRYFPGVDRYFMPFYSPTQDHVFPKRALRDLLPEHNEGINAVPQLLTKCAADFIWAARALSRMGYREVNLNLGCPSGTVVAKGKGSGLLARPEELDRFLEELFSADLGVSVSIKSRLGLRAPEEFGPILEIYNRYPISELIIHPRVRKDFYREPVRMDAFTAVYQKSRCPVCYNGDLAAAGECVAFAGRCPDVGGLMLGRGLVANPALASQASGGPGADKPTLRAFHDALYEGYASTFGSAHSAMQRMKEVWFYLIHLFRGSGRYAKELKKAADPRVYESLVGEIFQGLELLEDAIPAWRAGLEPAPTAQLGLGVPR